ncbi:hypothetical protein HWV62_664 [Athelia sp. TMB]|nr:hypothetical protein HWV62_664 [Athelia sp. TMB]
MPLSPPMDSMHVLTSIVVAAAMLVAYLAATAARKLKTLPPGPPGWPIIGNLLDLPKEFQWHKYKEWSEQYDSDIIHLKVFGTSIIVLSSLESISTLLEGRASIYSDRPKSTMVNELCDLPAFSVILLRLTLSRMGYDRVFAFMPYGPLWRSHRKAFHQEFQPQHASRHHPIEAKATHNLLRHLLTNPQQWFEHARHEAGSAIMNIAYGLEGHPENDHFMQIAEEAVSSIEKASIPGTFLVDIIPLLKYVPAWAPGAGFQRKAEAWKTTLDDLAAGNAKPSFVSRSLAAMDATGDLKEQERIIRETAAVIYAGICHSARPRLMVPSTTGIFMMAALLHPEVQAKAHAELDSVLGKGHLPTFADQESLPYVMAVVKETFRWETVSPLAVPRQVRQDDEYKGYHIPKGSIILQNSWAVFHDESVYPDHLAFKPERFLKDGRLDPTVQDPDVVSFGHGRRICPGKTMGFDSVWLNVASILAAFDIKKVAKPDIHTVEPKLVSLGIAW